MNIFSKEFWSPKIDDLPEPAEPKVPGKKGGVVIPDYLGSAKGSTISDTATNITNLDLTNYARYDQTMAEVIKKLVVTNPDLSQAVETKIKTAITNNFTIIAYDPTGRIDEAATETAQAFMLRLNSGSSDYTKFTRSTDVRSVAASMLYDNLRYDSMAAELVLGDMRIPSFVRPIAARLLSWADNTPTSYPIYAGPDDDVPLNFPTIFYSSSIQDNETPYSESPLQSVIQACLWDQDFVQDLRRAAAKNLLQRMKVTIDTDKFMAGLPADIKHDSKKVKEYMDELVSDLETKMADLSPEDTLVLFDTLDADTIADANRSEDRTIDALQSLINGKITAGAKILPAMIGRGESSTSASTESMLFLKAINSAQMEFNNLYSRVMTLALRLMGHDVYVQFALEEVNLRPGLELESFKSIKQARILELLSLGMKTDFEANIELTGNLPPEGYTPLSGTGFQAAKAQLGGNDYSNTSVSPDGRTDSTQSQKNNGDA